MKKNGNYKWKILEVKELDNFLPIKQFNCIAQGLIQKLKYIFLIMHMNNKSNTFQKLSSP